MNKLLCAGMAASSVLLGGGAASASTVMYSLNVDACTNTCGAASYGTVTVDGVGTNTLDFDVKLTSGVFNLSGNGTKPELFSLVGAPAITISSLTTGFTSNGTQSAGTINAQANFGTYDYQVKHTSISGLSELKFTVTSLATNLQLMAGGQKNGQNIYFTADIAGVNGNTGSVGATLMKAGVPEPATWGMMILGVAGVGSILRRKRDLTAPATVA